LPKLGLSSDEKPFFVFLAYVVSPSNSRRGPMGLRMIFCKQLTMAESYNNHLMAASSVPFLSDLSENFTV